MNKLKGVAPGKLPTYKTKKRFIDTALGRTLTLKNRTGKTIAGLVIGLVGGSFGLDTDSITSELFGATSFLDFLPMIVGALFASILTFAVYKDWISEDLKSEFNELYQAVKIAKSHSSEGGAGLTEGEKAQIYAEALDVIEQFMQERFGITYDIDGDGK